MSGIKPPGNLEMTNLSFDDFLLWLEAFKDFVFITQKENIDDKFKKTLFITIGGLELRKVVNSLNLPDDKFDSMIIALKKFIRPIKNLVLERHKFLSLKRDVGEDISAFIVRLRHSASMCEFENTDVDSITNQLIRDQFLRGINDAKLTESILARGNISLIDTINNAEALQQAHADSEAIIEKPSVMRFSQEKAAVETFPLRARSNSRRRTQNCFKCNKPGHVAKNCHENNNTQIKCFTCNKLGHVSSKCYKNSKCNKCHKVGHTSNVCRQKETYSLLGINTCTAKLNYINVTFLQIPVVMLVDTGAAVSVLSKNFVEKNIPSPQYIKCNESALVADGRTIKISSYLSGELCVNSVCYDVNLLVCDINIDAILGMDLLPSIGLRIGSDKGLIFSVIPDAIKSFRSCFDKPLKDSCLRGIEPLPIIRLEPGTVPKQSVVRGIPQKYKEFATKKLKELLDAGVVVESSSPWRHNPVIVLKADGSPRMTINYKPVNNSTIFDAYPLPRIEDMILELADARVFSSIDFMQFYHQLPLVKEDQEKTAFCLNGKLYHYTRTPFGLRNAVAYCSRLIGKLLADVPGVLVYLDDVLIYGKDQSSHDLTLKSVMKIICDAGLSLNSKKCHFSRSVINFLGYTVCNGTAKPDSSRTDPIINFPLPLCVKSLQRFLGMSTYYSKYIPHFSDLCKPLFDKVNCFDEWNDVETKAFTQVKEAITKAVLLLPTKDDVLCVRTDASDQCISAVLETDKGQPVYFCSRMLTLSEKRYDIVEREALAIFWGVIRLKSFLLGRKFQIFSDHKPLQYIFNTERCSPKVLRWKLQLQEYNFEVRYCKGVDNKVADCLSRLNFVDVMDGELFISENEVVDCQKYDCETQSLIKCLNNNEKTKPNEISENLWKLRDILIVKDSILCTNNDKLFIPFRMRRKVLTVGHGSHLGINLTLGRLRMKFFWPGMKKSIFDFVKGCRTCSLVRPKFIPARSTPILTKSAMEVVACDFVGPLPSSQGFRYMLVLMDVHSRYPVIYPVSDMTVKSVVECFKKFFSLFGFPDSILSDRGTQFESNDFKQFLSQFNIKKLRTTAYHPQGNGICEKFNGTIKKRMLAYLVSKNLGMDKWTTCLNHCLLDYRTTPHSAINCRPVDLFFSFRVHGYLPSSPIEPKTKNDIKAKEISKVRFDNKARNRVFPVGSEVLVRRVNAKKFDLKGDKCIVVKQLSSNVVDVKDLSSGRIFSCSLERLSLISPTEDSEEETTAQSRLADVDDESDNKPVPRRSQRVRFTPARLSYK